MKIPTAEEFFQAAIPKYQSVSEFMTDGDIFYHARLFAELHVKAALKEASKVFDVNADGDYLKHPTSERVIAAYPLSNIK